MLLVHHARKDSRSSRPGQALRGSSELHGWGDSNLYMRRRGSQLTLSTEHRAAASVDHMPLELVQRDGALALSLLNEPAQPDPSEPSDIQRVQMAMAQLREPVPVQQLRKLCGMRMASVCSALTELKRSGVVVHDPRGYQIKPVSLSRPIDPKGNGNGKRPLSED